MNNITISSAKANRNSKVCKVLGQFNKEITFSLDSSTFNEYYTLFTISSCTPSINYIELPIPNIKNKNSSHAYLNQYGVINGSVTVHIQENGDYYRSITFLAQSFNYEWNYH